MWPPNSTYGAFGDGSMPAATRATKDAGIRWEGQIFAVEGNPAVIQGAEDDSDAEA